MYTPSRRPSRHTIFFILHHPSLWSFPEITPINIGKKFQQAKKLKILQASMGIEPRTSTPKAGMPYIKLLDTRL